MSDNLQDPVFDDESVTAGVPAEAITVPGQACEGAFERWLMNTPILLSEREEDIAHEAFCSGWEAAAPVAGAQAAAAERARILVSDETLHADGSIGPDTAPPWGGDAAYWVASGNENELERMLRHVTWSQS